MKNEKIIIKLSAILVLLVWFNAGIGLLYSGNGSPRYVESIHGETVQLFGSGIYANNSAFSAAIRIGTDLIMLLVSAVFLITALKRSAGIKMKILHSGLLVSILYYSVTAAFETVFNPLFLSYTAMFAVALFVFIFSLVDLNNTVKSGNKEYKHTKTAVFTMLSGMTALVWLMDIIPSTLTGIPPDFMSIYTTSPTKIIDMGLIFPTCVMGGVMLLQKKAAGYILPPMMLIFLSIISVIVVGQTVVQMLHGIFVPIQQLVGYVGLFVVFGLFAAIVSTRFMFRCWPKIRQ